MKKTGLLKIVTIISIIVAMLTWLMEASYYSGSMQNLGFYRVGFFDLLNYPILTFQYFAQTFILVIVIGGFYGVLSKTGKYRSSLEKLAKLFKGKETFFLIGVAFVLAALNAFLGYGLLLFIFVPFLAAIVIMLGYDKVTALLITVLSPLIGVIGSQYSGTINGYINAQTGLDFSSNTTAKILLFVCSFVVYIFFTLRYAKKAKKNTNKAEEIENIPFIGEKKNTKKSICHIFIMFGLLLLILVLACTPWQSVFEIEWFANIHTSIMEFKVKELTVFSYLFGTIGAFGEWSITEMTVILILATVIIGKVYKLKLSDTCNAFGEGVIKFLKPAVVATLAMTVVIITAYHPTYLTAVEMLMSKLTSWGATLLILPLTLVTAIGSLLNIEMIYLSQSALPYLVGTFTSAREIANISLVTQSIYGLTMLIAPTSTVLILGLEYLNIPYKEWFKKSWKLIVELLIVILAVLIISSKWL